ncbi:TIGR04283 family arsenosugar biosynthesis glycosyltransferase [Halomonas elongata]|uniref:TIGR04283 family arsenosugar biosynthesis glycosyltransferase n=1 Tax=Halomonas elongata TaxID=2746 RepID=UPI0023AFFF40|nr:TIGR04283 family arsenosugar biosynthesis glycosyltransferase [Halomonas elongata]
MPNCSPVSLIIPVLDEASTIDTLLDSLTQQGARDVVIVDGGSRDATRVKAQQWGVRVLSSAPGRAQQMNHGARQSAGDYLLFLHADTRLPNDALASIHTALTSGRYWGRFDVRIDGQHPLLPVIATAMNRRSRLTGIATGDQGIFMIREVFEKVGGFPEQPLLEDIEMSKRLRQLSRPACLKKRVVTSGRRWERNGVWSTVWLMWRLRYRYWRGVPAERLATAYSHVR